MRESLRKLKGLIFPFIIRVKLEMLVVKWNMKRIILSNLKFSEECFPNIDDNKWLSAIEATRWLEHLKCVISGAVRIVDKIEIYKTSVLVHCSDGWDRTAQVIGFSMSLMKNGSI